jgi:hypothetical protein
VELPPLLSTRSAATQVLLGDLVPAAYGAINGVVLGVSKGAYLALQLLAVLGGFGAGLEHRNAGEGALRGVVGGTLFGAFILLGHRVAGTDAKVALPDPHVVLVVATALIGALLGALGGAVRQRRRTRSAPPAEVEV